MSTAWPAGQVPAGVAASILERAGRGQSWERIARELAIPAATARAVALKFGHPSVSHMRTALNQLTAMVGSDLVSFDGIAPSPRPESLEARAARELRAAATAQSPAELVASTVNALTIEQLLTRAAAGSGKVKTDHARVLTLLERIRATLIAEELDAARKRRVLELRRELAQLEAPRAAGGPARLECPDCDYSTVMPKRLADHAATRHPEETQS